MLFDLIKSIFRPSPTDKAFGHCMEADQALMVTVMTFYESYKAVGIQLSCDTSCFEELEKILRNCEPENKKLTLVAVGAFLGCIIREQLGGKWTKTKDGKYKIIRIGKSDLSIDLEKDLVLPLAEDPPARLEELYNKIAASASFQKR
ncbi:MAG: hypothetical protein ACFFEL_17285 [Candidatus Thorarchaeota archaeon]